MAKAPSADETKPGKDENGQGKGQDQGKGQAQAQGQAQSGGQAQGQGAGPSLSVLAQYVKDLSFENPSAPNSLRPRESSPNINININVNANGLSQNDFEVVLRLEAKASDGNEVIFNAELLYAGIFRLQGIPQDSIHPTLLIECPRLLFPFARQIIADATRNGGFPPLMIDPVDFARLYQSKIAENQAAGQAGATPN